MPTKQVHDAGTKDRPYSHQRLRASGIVHQLGESGNERPGNRQDRPQYEGGPGLRDSYSASGAGVQIVHDAMHDRVDGYDGGDDLGLPASGVDQARRPRDGHRH